MNHSNKKSKRIEWRKRLIEKRCEQAVLYLTQGKYQVMEGNKAAYLWHKTNWIAFGGMEIEKTWMNACTHINKKHPTNIERMRRDTPIGWMAYVHSHCQARCFNYFWIVYVFTIKNSLHFPFSVVLHYSSCFFCISDRRIE